MLELLVMVPVIIFCWIMAITAIGLSLVALVGIFRGK
jgi:hypothetical protein